VVFPVTVMVAVLAQPIVRVLLGSQWAEAAPIIQFLAVSGAVSAVTSNNAAAYMALGRPRLMLVLLGTRLAVLLAGVFWLARPYGIAGVATADFLASVACLAVSVPLLFSTVGIKSADYWRCTWRPLLAAVAMGCASWFVVASLPAATGVVAALWAIAAGALVAVLIYPLTYLALWRISGMPQTIEVEIARRAAAWLRGRQSGAR
jgi:O-antigen/teichoic acid export membrane protein